EIVSPSNKLPGPDRRAYLKKQREVLESQANLIELDLLRGGMRLLLHRELEVMVARLDPHPSYLVLINRAWRRVEGAIAYQLFPILISQPLPCIPIPLRESQEELPFDLQFAFDHAYDRGPYRRGAVDYHLAPEPPLPAELVGWAEARLREAARAESSG